MKTSGTRVSKSHLCFWTPFFFIITQNICQDGKSKEKHASFLIYLSTLLCPIFPHSLPLSSLLLKQPLSSIPPLVLTSLSSYLILFPSVEPRAISLLSKMIFIFNYHSHFLGFFSQPGQLFWSGFVCSAFKSAPEKESPRAKERPVPSPDPSSIQTSA